MPVAHLDSIRLLMAFACTLKFKLYQIDAKSFFLNGYLNKEMFVAQPKGFEDLLRTNHVYKLKKALYSLKQAPRAWFERLIEYLSKGGYDQGGADCTLFIRRTRRELIEVKIYVDDIVFDSMS